MTRVVCAIVTTHMTDPAQSASTMLRIIGFDTVARAWMSEPDPDTRRAPLPFLAGRLVVDASSQICAVDADGHPAPRLFAAMLLPGSVEDIVRMMRFCDEHGILVTSPHATVARDPGPVMRVYADACGRQRPMLRVVGNR